MSHYRTYSFALQRDVGLVGDNCTELGDTVVYEHLLVQTGVQFTKRLSNSIIKFTQGFNNWPQTQFSVTGI